MKHRYTMEDLERLSDNELLRGVVSDRMSDCTNVYSPLYEKLNELYSKLSKKIEQERSSKLHSKRLKA